ncbi:uncharacterized protein LOC124976307 [Sciurus carolinensis]|uniref:uncharacterized protein LOC124976307 n=1 Tax=Sciurus carolinensis TaxID=30640 RepID=UPI001FB4BFC1|nr:uncharacterized protein LOC124976307 [Sciurus carolinensis]
MEFIGECWKNYKLDPAAASSKQSCQCGEEDVRLSEGARSQELSCQSSEKRCQRLISEDKPKPYLQIQGNSTETEETTNSPVGEKKITSASRIHFCEFRPCLGWRQEFVHLSVFRNHSMTHSTYTSKRPEQIEKEKFTTGDSQTFQMHRMRVHVCRTRKRDSWASRKSGNWKLQPDGPSPGTVMAHWSVKSDFRGRQGCGLAEAQT